MAPNWGHFRINCKSVIKVHFQLEIYMSCAVLTQTKTLPQTGKLRIKFGGCGCLTWFLVVLIIILIWMLR